jgi:hypothetical protein
MSYDTDWLDTQYEDLTHIEDYDTETPFKPMTPAHIKTCYECDREFDLHDETDTQEWHYGHDCEA